MSRGKLRVSLCVLFTLFLCGVCSLVALKCSVSYLNGRLSSVSEAHLSLFKGVVDAMSVSEVFAECHIISCDEELMPLDIALYYVPFRNARQEELVPICKTIKDGSENVRLLYFSADKGAGCYMMRYSEGVLSDIEKGLDSVVTLNVAYSPVFLTLLCLALCAGSRLRRREPSLDVSGASNVNALVVGCLSGIALGAVLLVLLAQLYDERVSRLDDSLRRFERLASSLTVSAMNGSSDVSLGKLEKELCKAGVSVEYVSGSAGSRGAYNGGYRGWWPTSVSGSPCQNKDGGDVTVFRKNNMFLWMSFIIYVFLVGLWCGFLQYCRLKRIYIIDISGAVSQQM